MKRRAGAIACEQAALGSGVREIFLGTTERFVTAHRFYEKHGFERIDGAALPGSFPRMSLDTRFYRRSLEAAPPA